MVGGFVGAVAGKGLADTTQTGRFAQVLCVCVCVRASVCVCVCCYTVNTRGAQAAMNKNSRRAIRHTS